MLPETSGVYKIAHRASGRLYVGSTINFKSRWGTHIRKANTGRNTPLLQADWNEDGKEAFEFSVIEEVNQERLLEREQFHIDSLKPYYNRSPTAGTTLGVKHVPETIERNRQARLGISLSEDHRKAISKGVTQALSDPAVREKISKAMSGRAVGSETGKKLAVIFAKTFIITEPSGKSYEITNLSEFCRQNNLSQGHMSNVALGNKPKHKGWLCQHSLSESEAHHA